MTDSRELVPVEPGPPPVLLGTVPIRSPQEMVTRGSEIARALADVINDRKLYTVIQGKKFVQVEGWVTLLGMLGVTPVEISVVEKERETGEEYEARVELFRTSDGARIGGASATCGRDERSWKDRPRYAVRSMAITRATSKAARLAFSWIIKLAGYEGTPAEEMQGLDPRGYADEAPPVDPSIAKIAYEIKQTINRASKELRRVSPDHRAIEHDIFKRCGVSSLQHETNLDTLKRVAADMDRAITRERERMQAEEAHEAAEGPQG